MHMKTDSGNNGGKKEEAGGQEAWWQPALMMFARLAGWVIGPVIIGAGLGQWLDKKYGTDPWLLLVSVGIAFIVSMIGIVKNAVAEYKKIEELKKKK